MVEKDDELGCVYAIGPARPGVEVGYGGWGDDGTGDAGGVERTDGGADAVARRWRHGHARERRRLPAAASGERQRHRGAGGRLSDAQVLCLVGSLDVDKEGFSSEAEFDFEDYFNSFGIKPDAFKIVIMTGFFKENMYYNIDIIN